MEVCIPTRTAYGSVTALVSSVTSMTQRNFLKTWMSKVPLLLITPRKGTSSYDQVSKGKFDG